MNKHKGKKRMQKRPNYKNVGEEEDEERGSTEDAQEDAEKTKGTEGGSKSMKTSGEREGECTRERTAPSPTPALQPVRLCVLSPAPRVSPGCSAHLSTHQCTSFWTAQLFIDSCGLCHTDLVQAPLCVTWSQVSYP